ncbi:DUF5684 domain-containing protein [Microbacterium galbinum]|uniref:Signal peptidase I n=1 Tax=Microbacterium galbinum TaxID=2851646 RepID=A0ABY4IU19_9MICO|nr:DUF5684 domain-containing protein [Microbacterium galbinum]UPL14863.1 hypothetical protein KV396_10385 [Microbacterium galbinum]
MQLALVPAADVPVVPDFVSAFFSGTTSVIGIIFYVLLAIAWWKVFTKAGYPGILALIPIVNAIFLLRIAGMSGWWVLLYLVPIANVILAIVVAVKVGDRFGKGGAFSFFLLFLIPFIGYFILGFGDSRYRKA